MAKITAWQPTTVLSPPRLCRHVCAAHPPQPGALLPRIPAASPAAEPGRCDGGPAPALQRVRKLASLLLLRFRLVWWVPANPPRSPGPAFLPHMRAPLQLVTRVHEAVPLSLCCSTENDPYAGIQPAENWRPTAVLRTSLGHGAWARRQFGSCSFSSKGAACCTLLRLCCPSGWEGCTAWLPVCQPASWLCNRFKIPPHLGDAVTRVRPASEGLPDPLTVINYVTMSMPLLAPFIPIYKV